MNIYESPIPLPDCDTRLSFAARLRYNSQVHGAAGIPLGPVSIAGIIEETVADEMPFTDGDTLELLAALIDPGTCQNLNSPHRAISPAPFAAQTVRSARCAYPTRITRADGGSNP